MAVDLYSYGVMLYMLTSGGETSLRNPAFMPQPMIFLNEKASDWKNAGHFFFNQV